MSEALILEEMIWPEVEKVLSEVKLAVVPVGSCEQHGPNSTFVTDTARAYAFGKDGQADSGLPSCRVWRFHPPYDVSRDHHLEL